MKINRTSLRNGHYFIPFDLRSALLELDHMLPPSYKAKILINRRFYLAEHHGLGRWIRNYWGLWNSQATVNAFRRLPTLRLKKQSQLASYFIKRGVVHPDGMSSFILSSYRKHLHGLKIIREPKLSISQLRQIQRKERFLTYWRCFGDVLKNIGELSSIRKERLYPMPWIAFSLQDGYVLSAAFSDRDKHVCVQFCKSFDRTHKVAGSHSFKRGAIESAIGVSLEWSERIDELGLLQKLEGRITLPADPSDRRDWDRQHLWLANYLAKFHSVILEQINSVDTV